MEFLEQKIKGLYLIKPLPFKDKRGMLRRAFCKKEFKESKLSFDIKQINISENKKIYTLRGMHMQTKPFEESKVISCINGEIYNVVIDLRKNSKTKNKWQSFNLSEVNRISLLVPKGCANGYLTLKNNTRVLYFHSEYYAPGYEQNINYNDPYFKVKWPYSPKVISNKDKFIEILSN